MKKAEARITVRDRGDLVVLIEPEGGVQPLELSIDKRSVDAIVTAIIRAARNNR